MKTKLTLSIDNVLIDKAKSHLQNSNKSLSSFVEDYIKVLTSNLLVETDQNPIVSELTGIAKTKSSKNSKEVIVDYLLEKYS